MNREEFCKLHWSYYLALEKDFLATERYVSFDLGDNYLDASQTATDYGNSNVFFNEFIKQYQAICSEVDVILKSICKELENASVSKMPQYTKLVLKHWEDLPNQKVRMKAIELEPLGNWKSNPHNFPNWWREYNSVKHDRLGNFKRANLKNVVNALAGLYTLELYLVKFIGDRDHERDVPNDISKLFELIDFQTNHVVLGYESYLITEQEIDEICEI